MVAKSTESCPKKSLFYRYRIDTNSRAYVSENAAHILENFVFNELCRKYGTFDDKQIYYYSDDTCECDLAVNPLFAPQCIQVCLALNLDNTERELNGLFAAMDFFKIPEGVILTKDSYDLFVKDDKKITIMPAWDYFR